MAGSASEYFDPGQMVLPQLPLCSGCHYITLSISSQIFRLQGEMKCVICHAEGNMSCISDERAIQGKLHHLYTLPYRISKFTLLL